MTEWFDDASQALMDKRRWAVSRVGSGSVAGRWHPTGFAVFHLGEVDGIGRLRLHVWSDVGPGAVPGHPPIHQHNWDLQSTVLKGTYSDVIYVERHENSTPFVLHEYGYGDNGDYIRPRGQICLSELTRRSVVAGSLHRIPAGQLHETLIPNPQTVATLVFMSPARQERPVLAGPRSFAFSGYVRPPVSESELAVIREVLRDL